MSQHLMLLLDMQMLGCNRLITGFATHDMIVWHSPELASATAGTYMWASFTR